MKKILLLCITVIALGACSTDDSIEQETVIVTPPELLLNSWSLVGGVHDLGGPVTLGECTTEELNFIGNRDLFMKLTGQSQDPNATTCVSQEFEGTFFVNPEKTEVTTIINQNRIVRKIVKLNENELHLKEISNNNTTLRPFTFYYEKIN